MSTHTAPDLHLTTVGTSRSRGLDLAAKAGLAVAASAFVAVCAYIAVPLPFTPVPFTLQPFAVLLVGMLLGPSVGFAALVAYLCEGAMGLPVFTPGVLMGVARLLGPTGGYLFAYPIVAASAGGLPKLLSPRNRFMSYAVAGVVATLALYACGTAWFSHLLHVPFETALAGTVAPFAAADAAKICIAAGMASMLAGRTRKA